jgi:hypothetical protein
MLHQCPCGGIVHCNGWFDGDQQAEATRLRGFHRPVSHDRCADDQKPARNRTFLFKVAIIPRTASRSRGGLA